LEGFFALYIEVFLMRIYKIAQQSNHGKEYQAKEKKIFIDMFGDDYSPEAMREREKHKVISSPQKKSVILKLYRGFNYLPESSNGTYTLSPQNSEQQVLWFTHNLLRNINPIEYAEGHGKYLLTYPLEVIKHFQTISYDNSNESYDVIPKEIEEKINTFENCRYYLGYELPNGWFFSYKDEKFIVCTIPIVITKNMIRKV
jgi:hypothetical protein